MNKLKLTAILTVLALGLSACADTSYLSAASTVESSSSGSMTINESGTYTISEDIEGSVIIDASDDDAVELILDGCSITSSDSAAIYVKNAGEVIITTTEGTVNTLTNTTGFEPDGDTNVDGVIFSKDDLTISGAGTLVINSADHGIVSKDDLVIEGSTITINASGDGCQANDDLVINGGTIDIESCVEGLEGNTVTFNGGSVKIVSSDDAVNASGESGDSMMADASCVVTVNGGTVDITTSGDGIDSNGDLIITGGYVTISGPENSGNGSIDFAGSGSITGGTLIAAGMSGMEMNLTEATQGSILIQTGSQSSGTTVSVTDSSGNELMSFTPASSYNCLLISSPDLSVGQTYTITAGGESQDVTLEDYISGGSAFARSFDGREPNGTDGQTPPELPGDFDGQTPPELPDDFDGQTPPDFNGEQPPEGFDGQMPPER